MTKIPLKPIKWPKYLWNLKNNKNAPKTYRMIKIHPKPKKWLKYPETLKNDQKIMKPKNDKNTPKP